MEIEFDSSIPYTTLDPTGNTIRTTLSYLDPPVTGDRLIIRNGAIYSLLPQGSDGAKQILLNVPACSGTSTTVIRNWYNVFSVHAANHGIFVQPYFCFRLEANATTSFTVGDETDLVKFDLPGKFSVREAYWAMTIWTALAKPHVFPALSPMKTVVETNWSKGHAIIVPLHPLVIEQPSVLIRAMPNQLLANSVCTYFYKYVHFLVLRAFIEDNPKNLDNSGEKWTSFLLVLHTLQQLHLPVTVTAILEIPSWKGNTPRVKL